MPLSLRHEQLHCICIFSSDGANSTVEIERKNKEEIYYIFGAPNNVSGMNYSHNWAFQCTMFQRVKLYVRNGPVHPLPRLRVIHETSGTVFT